MIQCKHCGRTETSLGVAFTPRNLERHERMCKARNGKQPAPKFVLMLKDTEMASPMRVSPTYYPWVQVNLGISIKKLPIGKRITGSFIEETEENFTATVWKEEAK